MANVSLRIADEEMNWMETYARLHSRSVSDAVKKISPAKTYDEYCRKAINEYEIERSKR